MAEQDWKEMYRQQQEKRKKTGSTPAVRQTEAYAENEPVEHQPQPAPKTNTPTNVLLIRKIIVAIWLGITGIQIVIWLLIGIFGKHFPDPWWLWTGVSGAVVVGIVWYVTTEIQNHKRKGK